jgi:SAM-dependent methyltransferase
MNTNQQQCDAEAATVRASVENYILGNSAQEKKRLKLQATFLEKWTEQFLLLAGLEPGMRVLDLGCGMGDVSLLAARIVGTTGHVTSIDRDVVVIKRARERARLERRGADIAWLREMHSIRCARKALERRRKSLESLPINILLKRDTKPVVRAQEVSHFAGFRLS